MTETPKKPAGELALRTIAMPADTNANGDIFGGWLLSQMDLAGGLIAKMATKGRVVTVAIDSMTFLKPVSVGDAVCCYANIERIGNTSITIQVQVWVTREVIADERILVTEGLFTYVAIDEARKPRPIARTAETHRLLNS